MQYVSELIGAPVRDPAGRVVARVADLLVPADADYPAVDAVALKPTGGTGELRIIPWSALRVGEGERLALVSPLSEAPNFEPPPHELSLARQVMDHQIIDVNGVRVVRVNDLQLAPTDGTYACCGGWGQRACSARWVFD